MRLLWDELRDAVPMIVHGNPYLLSIISFTLQVAAVATALATAIGLPIGLAIGLGRFRGRNALRMLANASLAMPPVLVGVVLFVLSDAAGPARLAAPDLDEASGVHRANDPRASVRCRADRCRRPGPSAGAARAGASAGRGPTAAMRRWRCARRGSA